MLVPITGLYAALLTVVGLTLMVRVARMRARTGVSILHGDDMDLALATRQHQGMRILPHQSCSPSRKP